MSALRFLLSLLLLAAAAGPAAAFLAEGHGGTALLLPVMVFAAASVQGLPLSLRLPPGRLPSGSAPVLALRAGLALGVVVGFYAGSRHAPFLAALLPAGLRGLRLPRESRDLHTVRDALLVSVAYLAFEGSAPSLLSAGAVVLLAAAVLPVIHAAGAARRSGEEGSATAGPGGGGLRTALWAVPATALVAAVLFVALPRLSPKAGDEPSSLADRRRRIPDGARGGPGGSGEAPSAVPVRQIQIGDIGKLQRDLRPILEMTVTRGGRPSHAEDLGPLLRSGALESFDGVSWSSPDPRYVRLDDAADGSPDGWTRLPRRRPPAPPAGETVEQEYRFLAGGSDALFALGIPVAVGGPGVAGGVLAFGRGEVRAAETIAENSVVRVRSVAAAGTYPLLDDEVLNRSREAALLEVPPGHERTVAAARALLRGAAPGEGTLRVLEEWLAARCAYSLDLPESFEGAPVEAFLFEARRGHCELFASAAAVMLRSAGIPARVAIGFRGGVFDAPSLRYSFRGADAHAWVEAWFEDRGWVTFDPTPAAGPDRAPPEEADDGGSGRFRRWLDGVLRFDGASQVQLLGAAGDGVRRIVHAALYREDGVPRRAPLLPLLAALVLLAAVLGLRLRGPRGAAPAAASAGAAAILPTPESYAILLERCAAGGVPRLPAETAREHAGRALSLGLGPREAVERVVAAFEGERWGGRSPDAGTRALLRDLAAAVGRPEPARDPGGNPQARGYNGEA